MLISVLPTQKESQRWLDSLIKTESIIPNHLQVVTIADREADFFKGWVVCQSLVVN
ncbi:hypothetical protein [Okeania sp. KiyG1]|uniref:hypothetical protein n=1 Tax=Okeania sp. KiyG1 TaxID=2720165 RepID=UPI001920B945|nr:hypothetical protein [Okeania sp. KiyG1]